MSDEKQWPAVPSPLVEQQKATGNAASRTRSVSDDKQCSPVLLPVDEQQTVTSTATPRTRWQRCYDIIYWTPPNCRYDPKKPPQFSLSLNLLFAFAGAFTVANLYYNHPILNILARDFDVPYVRVSNIPTVAQAGYATGLILINPLGDRLPRRPFVLSLVFFTATICIGLAVTQSFSAFLAIQYISAVTTTTPQLMLPLVGDLAPPNRRATALSIVSSGIALGILIARLLSGIVTNYISWRFVYWISVGLQYLIFVLLWLFMPDYPSTNPGGLTYLKMLWSIVTMTGKHPVLLQACLIAFFTSATFTNFWTVLTFLLAGPPYHYSPLIIGLFALVGIAGMVVTPFYARVVIDRFVPWFSVLLGMGWSLLGICLGTYTGTFTVAGPILQAFLSDLGLVTSATANRSAIFVVEPTGRNRINTAYMLFTFAGQLVGTAVGSHLYEKGGWIASGSYSVASIGVAILITMARGPWEEGWVGWHGGASIFKKDRTTADGRVAINESTQTSADETKTEGVSPLSDVEEANGLDDDQHQRDHGSDRMAAVNTAVAENALELGAAEDGCPSDARVCR